MINEEVKRIRKKASLHWSWSGNYSTVMFGGIITNDLRTESKNSRNVDNIKYRPMRITNSVEHNCTVTIIRYIVQSMNWQNFEKKKRLRVGENWGSLLPLPHSSTSSLSLPAFTLALPSLSSTPRALSCPVYSYTTPIFPGSLTSPWWWSPQVHLKRRLICTILYGAKKDSHLHTESWVLVNFNT
jgi:hypothetical protein